VNLEIRLESAEQSDDSKRTRKRALPPFRASRGAAAIDPAAIMEVIAANELRSDNLSKNLVNDVFSDSSLPI
jgi:hypothetical protein